MATNVREWRGNTNNNTRYRSEMEQIGDEIDERDVAIPSSAGWETTRN